MEIYVGNLPWSMDDQALSDLFSPYGEVAKAKCMTDRETGRSRGFGFVTMNDPAAANAAIKALNGTDSQGRALRVNEAQPRAAAGGGGGGGGDRGDRGGGGDRGDRPRRPRY